MGGAFFAMKLHHISQVFTPVLSGAWKVDLPPENSCTTPDPQSPATALLLRSRTTVFPFFHFKPDLSSYCIVLMLLTTLFYINTLFHFCMFFLGFISSQPLSKHFSFCRCFSEFILLQLKEPTQSFRNNK